MKMNSHLRKWAFVGVLAVALLPVRSFAGYAGQHARPVLSGTIKSVNGEERWLLVDGTINAQARWLLIDQAREGSGYWLHWDRGWTTFRRQGEKISPDDLKPGDHVRITYDYDDFHGTTPIARLVAVD